MDDTIATEENEEAVNELFLSWIVSYDTIGLSKLSSRGLMYDENIDDYVNIDLDIEQKYNIY